MKAALRTNLILNNLVIFLRADANRDIGSGHVVRLLLLGKEFLIRGAEVVFVHSGIPEQFEQSNPQVRFIELDQAQDEMAQMVTIFDSFDRGPKALVTDGDAMLFYDEAYQQKVRRHGVLLVTVTFFADSFFFSDIIVNQNVRAPELCYKKEPYTEMLLGLKYAVLDRRFAFIASNPGVRFDSKREILMLFFGGADASDTTRWALRELRDVLYRFEAVHVIIGALYAYESEIREDIKQLPANIRLHHNTNEMPSLMAESKYAIASGGLALWELACAKTAMICIPSSKREILTCETLSAKKLVVNLGPRSDLEIGRMTESLEKMVDQSRLTASRVESFARQIDGDGASLVVDKVFEKLKL